jgi:sulfate permease, SulP family
MSIDRVVGPLQGWWNSNRLLADVLAGLACSLLSISYCLSYAALIFSGPLSDWLSYGIAITFLSAAVSAAVYASFSSIPYSIASPDTSTAALMASLVAGMAARLAHEGQGDLLPLILVGIAITTAATGLVVYVLGAVGAGRAIRFVPFPVIGGFLGATGCLMIAGSVQVATGLKPSVENMAAMADWSVMSKLAAALGVAVALHVLISSRANAYVLPLVLLGALVVFHACLIAGGVSLGAAQQAGWVFPILEPAVPKLPWESWGEVSSIPWNSMPWLAGDVLAVIFVTTISLLLNATGVEMVSRRDVNVDRELRALGLSNVVSASLGGYLSCLSLSRTTLAFASGAVGRATGFTAAVIASAILLLDPAILSFVPKFALAGLLLFAGGRIVHRWLIASVRQLQTLDYLALLAITMIIVQWGFIAGVVIGIIIGCATFALSASRVNSVKFSFDGTEYRSSLDRSPAELAILAEHGRELQGISLQSYLFFGSTSSLYQYVKALLAERPDCRFLLFDFRLVNGIDSSAIHNFTQINDAVRGIGAGLVLVNLSEDLRRVLRNSGVDGGQTIICDDLDEAMEICESSIIKTHRADAQILRTGRDWLAEVLHGDAAAERLLSQCRQIKVFPGQYIARQGEPSESMHFVFEGRLGVFVDLEDGRSVRVRSLGRHTIIGEMGLVTGRPRSATIRAEEPSELFELTLTSYNTISREDPALAQTLHHYMIGAMSERLSFANRMIGALQR